MIPGDPLPGGGVEIGARRTRVEDDALLGGRGCFVSDRAPAGCLHLAFARSAVARGRIVALDTSAARAVPGVVALYTGPDLAGIGSLPVNGGMLPVKAPSRPLLANGDVRFVGEPLAAVVARTPEAARDAAESIVAEVEALPSEVDTARAPREAFRHAWRSGDCDAAFAAADAVVRVAFEQPRVAASPLEPRCALAQWDSGSGTLTFFASSQSPHRVRSDLAALLGIDAAKVRAVSADVGGAFGNKASMYPEEVVVAFAARALGAAVKWVATRGEDLLSATHGRGGRMEGELALRRDGRFVALRASTTYPLGAWLPFSGVVPAWNAARILPGPYAVPNLDLSLRGVLTDTAPLGIYRGAGRPEAAMLMERLADEAARVLGMDPAELRRRNLLGPEAFPHETATGQCYDSGDYPRLLEAALELADYRALLEERSRRRAAGERFGVGLAFYVEPCGRGAESARVRMEADGRVLVASGTSPQGQGHATTLAQIAAEALGVSFDRIAVVQGDTGASPAGIGALASRSIAIGGSAVLEASRQVRRRLEAGEPLPLEASIEYAAPGEAWSAGCCVAAVSVDAGTGELAIERFAFADDAGRVVNPRLAEGQLVGGYAQGLGQALMERLVHDAEGQLLTGSLMDYALPRAADVPAPRLGGIETPATANSLGAKGVGESGTIGVPAALVNAARDALEADDSAALELPLTSEKLWRIMHFKEKQP